MINEIGNLASLRVSPSFSTMLINVVEELDAVTTEILH